MRVFPPAVLQRLRDGLTNRQIAAELGCSTRTVKRYATMYRAAGMHLPRSKGGRPRKPDHLLARSRRNAGESGDSGLREIVTMLELGFTAEQIAADLGCAVDLIRLVQEVKGVGELA